jgi:hypothetical protein
MFRSSRFWFLLSGSLLIFQVETVRGMTLDADRTGAVWIADARGILKVGARDADLLFEIHETPGTRALAVDRDAGILWAYGSGELRAFDFQGKALFGTRVRLAPSGGAAATQPIAAAGGGVVWLADGRQLFAFDAAGQQLLSLALASPVRGLALDGGRGLLWVATAERVAAYGADDGFERLELAVGERPQVVAIAADPATGMVWVAHQGRLQAHAADGTRRFEIPASPGDPPRAVAADGQGGLWVAGATWLVRVDALGRMASGASPFAGKGHIKDLVVDPATGEVWVARESELARVSSAGVVLRQVSFEPPVSILDLAFQGATETSPAQQPGPPPAAGLQAAGAATAGPQAAAKAAQSEPASTAPQSTPGPNQTVVSGTISLPSGAPASGAIVNVLGQPGATATTAADGSYSISNVPAAAGQILTMTAILTAPGGQILYSYDREIANPGGVTGSGGSLQPACLEDYANGPFATNSLVGSGTVQVNAMAPFGTGLVAAGAFAQSQAGTTKTTVNNIALWNGASWAPLLVKGGKTPGITASSSPAVQALAVFNGKLYVGGTFTKAGDVAVTNIASWDGTTWAAVGGGLPGTVSALGVWNGALYAGGSFTTSGSVHFNHVAKLSGTSWVPVGNGFDNSVLALTTFDDGTGGGVQLYAGGSFANGGLNGVARWNAATSAWVTVGGGVTGTVSGTAPLVDAFASDVESGIPTLYAGGSFTAAGGVTTAGVARWQSGAWSVPFYSQSGAPGLGNRVYALAFFNDGTGQQLFAAGTLGSPYNRLAFWNPALVNWYPEVGVSGTAGTDNSIFALAVAAPGSPAPPASLFAGGAFGKAGGYTSVRVAQWSWPTSCKDTVGPVITVTAPA